MTFTTAHLHVTTAQFVINCTLKYALVDS